MFFHRLIIIKKNHKIRLRTALKIREVATGKYSLKFPLLITISPGSFPSIVCLAAISQITPIIIKTAPVTISNRGKDSIIY